MNIAYVTADDPHNLRSWSGLSFYIAESLKPHGAKIHYLGPLVSEVSPTLGLRRRFWRLFGKRVLEDREPSIVRGRGRQVMEKLKGLDVDLILATHTELLAECETDLPIAYWSDSNFDCMLGAYPYFQSLNPCVIRRGHDYERRALARAGLVFYACDWARDAAIKTYGIAPEKVKVIPFGANIQCDRSAADVDKLIAARPRDRCQLLFLGKVWERKGGDTAVAVAEELNRSGLPTTLTLIGSQPPEGKSLPLFVRKTGFINKSDPAGLKQFNDLIAQSHFLILPSRAEAFGIVFCEASSFGVPSLATKVGGIPTAVRDGGNGQTFPLDAPPADYAAFVRQQFANYASYEALARSAFREFETRLNWGVSGATAMGYLRAMLAQRGS
ncbi:MAG: glycosyltransferase [Verrucomicrobia bacterium]|nr:glycosyltransferase [Verrucomicrobiota bacterium]NBU10119.1 glycosyltransferase [Pseudomonadota bacterium]NDA67499.1 glycosyltransferase [Verrucomicrobiota bacterium]NDD40222.1 glycosyltransferase [Verrucomicrobiota bacterium]NDF00282.1 glycosyltransferase [Verrucomicrobiota bacterium]